MNRWTRTWFTATEHNHRRRSISFHGPNSVCACVCACMCACVSNLAAVSSTAASVAVMFCPWLKHLSIVNSQWIWDVGKEARRFEVCHYLSVKQWFRVLLAMSTDWLFYTCCLYCSLAWQLSVWFDYTYKWGKNDEIGLTIFFFSVCVCVRAFVVWAGFTGDISVKTVSEKAWNYLNWPTLVQCCRLAAQLAKTHSPEIQHQQNLASKVVIRALICWTNRVLTKLVLLKWSVDIIFSLTPKRQCVSHVWRDMTAENTVKYRSQS